MPCSADAARRACGPALALAALFAVVMAAMLWPGPAPAPQKPEATSEQPAPKQPPAFEDFAHAPAVVEEKPLPPAPADHGLALIIDDLGYDPTAIQRLLALNVPLALSVLPDAPYAREAANMAHEAGQIVMLHLPMEPESRYLVDRMSSAFLRVGMDRVRMRQVFAADLARVPHAVGVNNHMGSRLTQMPAPMLQVMELCRERGLFFVDSRTHRESVAAEAARLTGIAWASRRFFLDHRLEPAALAEAWRKAVQCARMHRCILIAHPHRQTLDFLETVLAKQRDYPIVELTRILHPARHAS